MLEPLEVHVQRVGEFGGEHVRRLVEDGEGDEERLVAQGGLGVAEPLPALPLDGRVPEVGEAGRRLFAAVVAGHLDGEPGHLGGPVGAAREEVADGAEGEQTGEVSGLFPQVGQVGAQHRGCLWGFPGGGGDSQQERGVLQGHDQIPAGLREPVAGRVQVGVAQRAVAAQRQIAQDVAAGRGELGAEVRRAGLGGQRVDGGHAQVVQEHERRGVAAGGVGAGEDQDALVAQPVQGGGEGGALDEDRGERVEPLPGISPET